MVQRRLRDREPAAEVQAAAGGLEALLECGSLKVLALSVGRSQKLRGGGGGGGRCAGCDHVLAPSAGTHLLRVRQDCAGHAGGWLQREPGLAGLVGRHKRRGVWRLLRNRGHARRIHQVRWRQGRWRRRGLRRLGFCRRGGRQRGRRRRRRGGLRRWRVGRAESGEGLRRRGWVRWRG